MSSAGRPQTASASTAVLPIRVPLAGDTGTASHSTNNTHMSSIKFGSAATEYERYQVPVPTDYTGSNGIDVSILFTTIASGAGGEGVRFTAGYAFLSTGDDLGSMTFVEATIDVSSVTADELTAATAIVTIPHAAVDTSADLFMFAIGRVHDHADDNYANDLYIHKITLSQAA